VILLDESLASLDQGLKSQILPFIRKVKDLMGIPMLYVSHDLGEVLQLTRHLVILDRGRVVGQGAFTDLVEETDALAAVEPMGLLNVLELEVRGHEPEHGLTSLAIGPGGGGQLLRGPLRSDAPGGRIHAALRPEDIALALGPISGVSIQNQLEGRIARFKSSSGKALVEVDIGTPGAPVPLLVDVSLKTLHDLGIVPGGRVWCLVKANAVRYV
jgi:molybdate transport system ATP-binding protein